MDITLPVSRWDRWDAASRNPMSESQGQEAKLLLGRSEDRTGPLGCQSYPWNTAPGLAAFFFFFSTQVEYIYQLFDFFKSTLMPGTNTKPHLQGH